MKSKLSGTGFGGYVGTEAKSAGVLPARNKRAVPETTDEVQQVQERGQETECAAAEAFHTYNSFTPGRDTP